MFTWLDHRVGIRKLVAAMLLEGVPGGAKWRYVWGSCLAFVFSIQLITGLMLMTAYSPSSSQAWNSVHFIQYKMDFGWLIRGLHHFGSQTMMVLIALHMLQVVIAGAQLPPREINWWLGIGLFGVVFGLSLTGYLLPWDQKGYWATRVATNISSNIPVLGPHIRQFLVGGPDYGNHTLTRFYALHVGILPLALIVLLVAHIVIFRRHGVTSKQNVEGLVTKPENEHGAEPFWPRQAFYDMVACMAVFGVMVFLVMQGFGHKVTPEPEPEGGDPGWYREIARAGELGKGADLAAAADRDTPNYPARPEWYFLFLFQLLKYFEGDQVLIGTVFIPNGVMVLLVLLPLFGIGPFRKLGYLIGIVTIVLLLGAVGVLTLLALDDDSEQGILDGHVRLAREISEDQLGEWGVMKKLTSEERKKERETREEKARAFQKSVHEAEIQAQRASQIAMAGTPVEGGHQLLRNDPFSTGRRLFEQKCGSCHNFSKREGDKFAESWTGGKTASDLGNFGSEAWVRGLLQNPMDNHYFGLVKKVARDDNGKEIKNADGKLEMLPGLTGMRGWRDKIDKARNKTNNPVDGKAQDKEFDSIAKWLAYLGANPKDKRKDEKLIEEGQTLFESDINKCSTCHSFEKRVKDDRGKWTWAKEGDATAPDLTGYGSAEWIRGMIMRPGHKSRYGERNLMPTFRDFDGPGGEIHQQEFRETNENTKENTIQHLSDVERELIIRWMLRDYRPVFGGATIK